ncbi:MAG TPA: putative glycoside hydrolase [Anaerolineae bacterium]|nr:putative glycoside hydrolase [Anaerolineae bacterium]
MPRPYLFLLALVLVVLLFGCAGLTVSYFDTKTLQGTVTDAQGAPVAHAALTVAGRSTFSNEQGQFQIQFPRGTWELRVFADGFQETAQLINADDFFQQDYSATIMLQPKAWRGRIVTQDTQQPVPNARVEMDGQVFTTNAQGEFLARGVRNGTKLKITLLGFPPVTVALQSGSNSNDTTVIPLPAAETRVTILDASSNKPLPGVRVTAAGQSANTDINGVVTFHNLAQGTPIFVHAGGYAASSVNVGSDAQLTLKLQPTSLQGRVLDSKSNAAIQDAVILLANADGTIAPARQTGADGKFALDDLSHVQKMYVKKPGYLLGAFDAQGGQQDFTLTPFNVKGIHLYYGISREQAERVLTQLKNTEMNAVVFDVKESPGYLLWDSQVPLAKQIGAYLEREYTAQDEVATCRAFHLYCIARLTVFKDTLLAQHRPDLALHNARGGLLYENEAYWTNPAKQLVQDYHIALAKELAAMGFDEIQFDYIRYPGTQNVLAREFGDANYRVSTIQEFLQRAADELRPTTAFFSGDVFGLTTAIDDEQGIGQVWEKIASAFDYVSPMMYPSTWRYATNLWGSNFGIHNCFDAYNCPYDIIHYGMLKARQRTASQWTLIRPWLQAYGFGLPQFLAQAKGADDANSAGYLFWNNLGVYPDGLFKNK